MLTYHQATVALAGLSLTVVPDALARLEDHEKTLGFRLPAAVREWYSLDPPPCLMGLGDNQDWPYDISSLGKIEGDPVLFPEYNPLNEGYLAIMVENQSVVLWAVQLNGTDDPPIVVLDGRPDGAWHHHADRFSEFVYTRVWDYQTMFRDEGCRVEGGSASVDDAALTWLSQHYHEGPRTLYWPCEITYRFSDSATGARILIGNSPLYGLNGNSYNYFWAPDAGGLMAALRNVSRFRDLLESLWSSDDNEYAYLVVEMLRQ